MDANKKLAEEVWAAIQETWHSKGVDIIAAYGERRYREGVEAMRDAALAAYRPSGNPIDDDVVERRIKSEAARLLAEAKEGE